jgi:hypothetical protein
MEDERLVIVTRTPPDGEPEAEPMTVRRDGDGVRLTLDDGETLDMPGTDLDQALQK